MATSLTGQTLLTPDQANAETTANEFLLANEQLGALNIKGYLTADGSRPASPADFDAYIVSGVVWDTLTTTTNDVVFYYQGWILIQKKHGMVANISDDAVPEFKGLISYDSVEDAWFRVQEPIWYTASTLEHFTGRYFNNLFTGTTDYPIHARAYKGTLSATTTTVLANILSNPAQPLDETPLGFYSVILTAAQQTALGITPGNPVYVEGLQLSTSGGPVGRVRERFTL